jgi:hypothetical protein
MSLAEPLPTAVDVIFENILEFLLPFFLSSAGGNADLGRCAIQAMAEAHDAATVTELDLVGRILGFSVVAMDNLRLSMSKGMSDNKILRYRSNAVALSRAGEQCRIILEVVQAKRKSEPTTVIVVPPRVPAPRIEPAPAAVVKKVPAERPVVSGNGAPARGLPVGGFPIEALNIAGLPADFLSEMPKDIEAMKRDARIMMAAFSQKGGTSGPVMAVVPKIADSSAMIDAAVREAFAQTKGKSGTLRR